MLFRTVTDKILTLMLSMCWFLQVDLSMLVVTQYVPGQYQNGRRVLLDFLLNPQKQAKKTTNQDILKQVLGE